MSGWQPQQYDPRQHQRRMSQPAPPPQWQPPAVGQWTYPSTPKPARSAPPFPKHLVRFPAGAFPRQQRRGRNHGIMFYVWLGSHPVMLLLGLYITAIWLALLICYAALVVEVWLIWVAVVTVAWLCRAAVSPLLHR